MVTLTYDEKREARTAINKAAITAICLEDPTFQPSAVADVLDRFERGTVTLNELPGYLKQVKEAGEKPHWYRGAAGAKAGSQTELEHRAFVVGEVTQPSSVRQTVWRGPTKGGRRTIRQSSKFGASTASREWRRRMLAIPATRRPLRTRSADIHRT